MRPEDYWINRGEDVIGLDVLADGEHARQAATYETIARLIYGNQPLLVLDIGCNVAALKDFLEQQRFLGLYVGIDTNKHALKIAQRKALVEVGNLRKLRFSDRQFHSVVVKDVIEHLESPEPLREAFRVSNRYVIIATYLPWHDAPSQIAQHPDGYYTNIYNRQEIIALARECGFELIETIPTKETNGTANEVTVWERQ